MRRAFLVLTLVMVASGFVLAQTVSEKQRQFEIEHELSRLPTYGVFDFLAFTVEKGNVTLMGSVYQSGLKSHAERALRRVPGVDHIENKIEQLPVSPMDDRIRWATFYKIYTDDFLSRYSPGGAMGAHYELTQSLRFPGVQPLGAYPIHIIVKNGRTTLMGVVGSEMDKRMAEIRAREVGGTFAVENELIVETD